MIEALKAPDEETVTIAEMIERAKAARTESNARQTDELLNYLREKGKENETLNNSLVQLADSFKNERKEDTERKAEQAAKEAADAVRAEAERKHPEKHNDALKAMLEQINFTL